MEPHEGPLSFPFQIPIETLTHIINHPMHDHSLPLPIQLIPSRIFVPTSVLTNVQFIPRVQAYRLHLMTLIFTPM